MAIIRTINVVQWADINQHLAENGFGEALGGDLKLIAPTWPARDAADFIMDVRLDAGITHSQYAGA
jgi:hypothetical protein